MTVHRITMRQLAMRRLDEATAVPQRFGATASLDSGHEVELEIEVDEDGTAACLALTVHEGGPITTDVLRGVHVRPLLREALTEAARPYEQLEGGDIRMPVFSSSIERAKLYEQFSKGSRRPRRGSPLTKENLSRVAELYRAALENGDPPTQTVADAMHATRSTASRWVAKAREHGFLGPAVRGRAGEAS
jgi:uncharacterized protein DUF6214